MAARILDDISTSRRNSDARHRESRQHLARGKTIDRIVALDEFDMETAATLREHLRIPGMGLTTVRYFRDKLAMRARARHGIRVPEFVPVLNHATSAITSPTFPARGCSSRGQEASAIGIKKSTLPTNCGRCSINSATSSRSISSKSSCPATSSTWIPSSPKTKSLRQRQPYGNPPINVAHEGGVFTTTRSRARSEPNRPCATINRELIAALGLVRGVSHAEFIRAHEDGEFYFLESAARVGGA